MRTTNRRLRLGALALVSAQLLVPSVASAAPAHAAGARVPGAFHAADISSGVALQWYDITNQTVNAATFAEPVIQSRAWSISWLAAARAVQESNSPDFQVAAFAQALHDTLVSLVPAQQPALDSDLASTLASIPDGTQKQDGIAAGQQQAEVVLAERQNDGLSTAQVDAPYTPPAPGPGVWQPTPPSYLPAIRSGEGNAQPFILSSGGQIDPGPPPSLTSPTYLKSLAEVRAYGAADSTVRTPAETDIAAFWEPAINIQEVQLLRGVLAEEGAQPLGWQSRLVAVFNAVTTDAQIAVYHAKFKYVFWRPVTAIRDGAVDPDPNWTPFFTTPRYPDWISGHGGVAGAAQAVLTAFAGPRAPAPIEVTSPTDPGVTHAYQDWGAVTQEVVDARVWEGIHFRFSDQAGALLGGVVGIYDLTHLSRIGL
jgi:hypothetical protein